MTDPWTWTIDYLSIHLSGRFHLVPPCPDLPRTIHKAPEVPATWSLEAKARHSVKMTKVRRGSASEQRAERLRKTRLVQEYAALHPGVTQKTIADALGMWQPAVSRYLREKLDEPTQG